ncbi:hypothetical protein GCM10011374_36370 [Kocuria dechangensis]|uniref:Uncharacterized protein n=1 Tax=Kocuria dechangensis TaxID=1176249 RepID=A0A917LZW2_9MICC|nr:hypothetical protein [Kocuria dechangensis]GGG68688.1 hypothetical protein GCM10011374_36370 [Kocuria dechangensis]
MTTFRENDHPRGTHGKFNHKAHDEAPIGTGFQRSGPYAKAETELTRAFTNTDSAWVEFDTGWAEGPTRVLVGTREVAMALPEDNLSAVLSDAVVAERRRQDARRGFGDRHPYRSHDTVTALTAANAFESIADKDTDLAHR